VELQIGKVGDDAGDAVQGHVVDDPGWKGQSVEVVECVARTHMLVVVDLVLVLCSRYCSPGELDKEPP
jgi:hypothetical protein